MKPIFHKVISVEALPDFVLGVRFAGGVEKRYDMKPVFARWPMFDGLRASPELFREVAVGPGGYGVVWGDEWDVGADELFANGVEAEWPMCAGEAEREYRAEGEGLTQRHGGTEGIILQTRVQNGEEGGMKKPVAYLETSFVSYLTGRTSPDKKVALDQAATRQWWEEEGTKWQCVVSQAVFDEARGGDAEASGRRLDTLKGVASVQSTADAVDLADTLVREHALPEKARADAMHVALATVHGADVLLTWNCRHIANPVMLPKIYSTLEKAGYKCPAIATPGQLLEGRDYV